MADQSAWQQNMCGNFLPRGWCWCAEAGGWAECPITTSLMSSPRPWSWSDSGLAEYRNYQIIVREPPSYSWQVAHLNFSYCHSKVFHNRRVNHGVRARLLMLHCYSPPSSACFNVQHRSRLLLPSNCAIAFMCSSSNSAKIYCSIKYFDGNAKFSYHWRADWSQATCNFKKFSF